MMGRLRAVVGIAVAQLRHDRRRTIIAAIGIAVAVLGTILLLSVGVGVIDFGQAKFDSAGRDLWITGGTIEFQPGSVGGVRSGIVDSHDVATALTTREDVADASPLMFQTVYASPNQSSFETVAGVGGPARGGSVSIVAGREVNRSYHYAGGSYDGPMTHEIAIDRRTATLFNVSVGDTLHVGGTIATARQHEFTVVGITNTYSEFVGAPTLTMPHSELQTVTGKTASDRATFISVRLADGVDPEQTAAELERVYPDYEVRTNREQLRTILQDKAVVIASGVSLILLAVVAGVALTLNLLLSMIFQRKREFAAAQAIGVTSGTLLGTVVVRSFLVSLLGGVLGALLAVPSIYATNVVANAVTGFEGLVVLSPLLVAAGFGIAVVIGLLAGIGPAVYLYRSSTVEQLAAT